VPVLSGDYEIRYQTQTSGATTPWNEWGFAGMLNISGDVNELDINIESVELGGTFNHNGVPTKATEYDDGNFYLETVAGDRVFLENSHNLAYEKHVMLGNYDIYCEVEIQGDTVPFNERARIGSNVSVATGKLNINMTSYPVSGSFTLNGGAFPVLGATHRANRPA